MNTLFIWSCSYPLPLSGLIQQTTNWQLFLIFARKQVLTFHANCLQWRQFARNAKTCFLRKKKIQMLSVEIFTQHAKNWLEYVPYLLLEFLLWYVSLQLGISDNLNLGSLPSWELLAHSCTWSQKVLVLINLKVIEPILMKPPSNVVGTVSLICCSGKIMLAKFLCVWSICSNS